MKYSSILLLLISLVILPVKELRARPNSRSVCSAPVWQPDSKVSVYFVREMFSTEQQRAVLEALASSASALGKMGMAVNFSYAGETDGLIDCERCLTVARQAASSSDRKSQTTLNSLRRNSMGQLISAWVALDQKTNSVRALRESMLEAMLNVQSAKASAFCKK